MQALINLKQTVALKQALSKHIKQAHNQALFKHQKHSSKFSRKLSMKFIISQRHSRFHIKIETKKFIDQNIQTG